MSFSSFFNVLPSFKNHYDIEFCRQLILNQISNAFLFFDSNSKIIHDFIIELLKLPGNDPIRDVPILLFKWSCRCFFNRMKPPVANPSVPLDFSFTHPELVNFEILYSYASNENLAENLLRLNDTFPYELFKVISMMKPEDAQEFASACGFNSKIPIHMSGRIISIFPLSIVTIDFSKIFRMRCYKSYTNFIDFFEGLLCNADFNLTQITAAQLLSDHFDDLLFRKNDDATNEEKKETPDQCLQLINTSMRKIEYFLDNNFALSMHLFPSQCTTLSFLLQTSAAPFSTLSKAIKKLPPSEYITRFTNQMKLMQVVGLGEDWKKLEEHSLPYLIGPDQLSLIPVILVDIPRTSRFLTLQSSDFEKDYDFIQAYLVIDDLIKNQKMTSKDFLDSLLSSSDLLFTSQMENSFLSDITTDLFSLLFLKKKSINAKNGVDKNDYFDVLGRRRSNSMSFLSNSDNNNQFPTFSKSGSTNHLMKQSNSDFLFDAETAQSVVSLLLSSGKASNELKPYLERALIRIRCAMSLFERPVRIEAVLLPHNYFYLHALTSLELIDMLIKCLGNPPSFVISRQFTLVVSRSLFLRDRAAAVMISSNAEDNEMTVSTAAKSKNNSFFNPFADRLSTHKPLNHHTEKIFDEVLNQFPSDLHSLIVLDFVSSRKKFTILAKRNQDKNYELFVKKLLAKSQRYPQGSTLNLLSSRTLNDLQKKLCSILSFGMSNNKSILTSWCAFLFLLTSIPSQTYQKFQKDPVETQIVNVINDSDSIQAAVERFADTGIDVLKVIFKMKNISLLKENLVIEIIKFNPLVGVTFSLNTSVNKRKIVDVIQKKDNFNIITNFLEKSNHMKSSKSKKDILSQLLNENDKNKFNQTFEEKVDEIIRENKVLLLLQKLNSNTNNSSDYQQKAMLILDYLIFKVDLSPYFETILPIVSHYPKDWSVQFIETFISLADQSNEMIMFPLQQQLSELKPKRDFSQMTEIMKVCSTWDYLIKEVTRFKNVIEKPEKFYRLCSLHLMSHEVGHSLIILVQAFTQILLYIRNYKIFSNDNDDYLYEKEKEWITKYLKYGISSLKESVLAEMIVDIGLNYDYECGLAISSYFKTKFGNQSSQKDHDSEPKKIERTFSGQLVNVKVNSSISDAIKKKLPSSIYLISYVNDPQQLAEEILSEKVVNSIEEEQSLLHLLVMMKSFEFAENIPLYNILYTFTHIGVFLRFRITYSGSSISDLRDVAELCDLLNKNDSFESLFNGVDVSDSVRKKLNDCYSIFGLLSNRSTLTKKLIFTSPFIDFNTETVLNEAASFLNEKLKSEKEKEMLSEKEEKEKEAEESNNLSVNQIISNINNRSIKSFTFSSSVPNIFSLSADASSLSLFSEPLQQENSEEISSFFPDFKFFDIDYKAANGEPQLRISPDPYAAVTETIAFSEVKSRKMKDKKNFFTRNEDGGDVNDFVLFNAVHDAVVSFSLFDLFDSLSIAEMRRVLEFANERSLIFFILQLTIWVQEHQEFLQVFVFPGSSLESQPKSTTNNSNNNQNNNNNINKNNQNNNSNSINKNNQNDNNNVNDNNNQNNNNNNINTNNLNNDNNNNNNQNNNNNNINTNNQNNDNNNNNQNNNNSNNINENNQNDNSSNINNSNIQNNNNDNNNTNNNNGNINNNQNVKINNNSNSNNASNNDNSSSLFLSSSSPTDLAKTLDFVLALKFTLISATRISYAVDSSRLLPPSIIKSGARKNLDDLCLAVEHQLQIGVSNLNLFEEAASTGNVAHVIAQVFVNYGNDYDRGFALTRVFHADIDEVMIEAAALVASRQKNGHEQLVQFLLGVLPRLDSSSSSQLIQALSSILVRNSSNEHFLKLILAGIDSPQSSSQMLRSFGYTETARDFALLNDLGEEVEMAMKDAVKKGKSDAVRICKRWISQHKQQT